jgi:hypothetical protein
VPWKPAGRPCRRHRAAVRACRWARTRRRSSGTQGPADAGRGRAWYWPGRPVPRTLEGVVVPVDAPPPPPIEP